METRFSIIIAAWKAQDFIEECLDSIEKQTYFKGNDDYEILLGIDACKLTLEKVEEIKHKYRNLKVFVAKENVGPYVVTNSLIKKASKTHYIIFGADDVMNRDMIDKIATYIREKNPDFVRFKYTNFDENGIDKKVSNKTADGVFCCRRYAMVALGGFMDWRCAADTELRNRAKNMQTIEIHEPLFLRRIHPESLCVNEKTNAKSALRQSYVKQILQRSRMIGISIKPVTIDLQEIKNVTQEQTITTKEKTQEKKEMWIRKNEEQVLETQVEAQAQVIENDESPLEIDGYKIHTLFEKKKKNIQLSVAIPCYNVNEIIWLCMESLCRQKNIKFDWEIVICEEHHPKMVGMDPFKHYIDRLSSIRCKKITYIELPKWVNLPEKWKIIGKHIDNYKGAFLLQAADCYAPSKRLSLTHELIVKNGYDWIDFMKGYFYNMRSKKMMLYNSNENSKAITNLHMAFKSKYAKHLRSHDKNVGVDGFLFNTIKDINPLLKKFTYKDLLKDGLDTDGHNNISKKRMELYENTKWPFEPTSDNIEDLGLPQEIIEKIMNIQ